MRRQAGVAVWLVALAAAEVVVFLVIWRFFVRSEHGQLLDSVALTGNRVGRSHVYHRAEVILGAISAASLVAATAAIGFIALVRRQVALAAGAVLLIAGANATTQVVKHLIHRPYYGVDPQLADVGNTLPSGHTTVAASVAVALLMVLPHRVRGIGAVLGAVGAAGVGVGTLSAGWHRPSDAIAAVLVAGGWACAAALFVLLVRGRGEPARYAPAHAYAVLALAAAGVLLLAGAGLALVVTNRSLGVPADELGRAHLFTAYAGGAMGIAGATAIVVAAVLASVHRVVPEPV